MIEDTAIQADCNVHVCIISYESYCKLPKVQWSLNKHYRKYQQLNMIAIGADDVNNFWTFYMLYESYHSALDDYSKVLVLRDNIDSMTLVYNL